MRKKKRYMAILLPALILALGTTAYADDMDTLSAELSEAVDEAVQTGQEMISQVSGLAAENDGDESIAYLQSLAEECDESISTLTASTESLQGDLAETTQMTGSIIDTSASTQSVSSIFQAIIDNFHQINKKNDITNMTDGIRQAQEQQKIISAFLETARELKNQETEINTPVPVPEDMAAFFTSQGLTPSENWDENINSLESLLEKSGTDIQSKMAQMQDAMSEYNSSTQTLSSMMDSLHSSGSIAALDTGSIYGRGKSSLVTAPVVTSGLIGLSVGMLLMYFLLGRRKKTVK